MIRESRTVREGIGPKFGLGIRFTTMFFAGFAVGFAKGWLMTLVLLAMAPLLAIAGGLMMNLMVDLEKQGQDAYSKAGAVAQERLESIRTVQACGKESDATEQYIEYCKQAEKVCIFLAMKQILPCT